MGVILELPPEAAPFTAELRSSSFYLGSGAPDAPPLFLADLTRPVEAWSLAPEDLLGSYAFTVAGTHVPALLVALAEVGRLAPPPTWLPLGRNPWRVEPAGDGGLTLLGPASLYGVDETMADEVPVRTIEIEYRYLWSLRVTVGDPPKTS